MVVRAAEAFVEAQLSAALERAGVADAAGVHDASTLAPAPAPARVAAGWWLGGVEWSGVDAQGQGCVLT